MPEETIVMTKMALHRLRAVEAVVEGRLKPGPTAEPLGVTTRQVKRLVAAYRRHGAVGLVSRRVGQPSNRRFKEPVRAALRALLVERDADCGPTRACEKRREVHDIAVSVETVRRLHIELGRWKPMRRKAARAV